jgi:5-methylcytosine-specific restriction endonuclease McrA
MPIDAKPRKRIKDPALLRTFSLRMGSCSVCGESRAAGLQAHHVLLRSRGGDDVTANLVALCGPDHTAVHDGHRETRHLLGQHIVLLRPDVLEYLKEKLGGPGAQQFILNEYGPEL